MIETLEHRETRLKKRRAYYSKNRIKILAAASDYHRRNSSKNQEKNLSRATAWYLKNKHRKRAYDIEYRKKNGWKYAESHRAYARTHKESTGKWMRTHPEEMKAIRKRWYDKNPHKRQEYNTVRRSLQLGAVVGDESQMVQFRIDAVASKETRCVYCSIPLWGKKIHVDHIIPLTRGGAHSVENLCVACPKCNLSKGSRLLSEWKNRPVSVEVENLV